jgi:hypothetical protein
MHVKHNRLTKYICETQWVNQICVKHNRINKHIYETKQDN